MKSRHLDMMSLGKRNNVPSLYLMHKVGCQGPEIGCSPDLLVFHYEAQNQPRTCRNNEKMEMEKEIGLQSLDDFHTCFTSYPVLGHKCYMQKLCPTLTVLCLFWLHKRFESALTPAAAKINFYLPHQWSRS